ncbi:MAG: hypothetical protein OEY25_13450 [Candidatus Aminicenantes bacterium]|nr:hypothetical protein [Candidatus Aminicenantes bacterium]MDH5706894.1 hypothetical protein [Candidatus Aminicenantes bacterium]
MKALQMRTLSKGFKKVFASRLPALSFILFLSIFFLVGCGLFEVDSKWRDRDIAIDGKSGDWLNAMLYFEEERISLGLLNDENFMYICMIVDDPFIRGQIVRQGFELWFNPKGGKKKIFGIRFPIGMLEAEMPPEEMKTRRVPMKPSRDELDPERLNQVLRRQMDELEILGPGKDESMRMPVEKAKGIEVKIEIASGMIVYELKVPLHLSDEFPFAIGAKAGDLIGVRLETPKMDSGQMRRRMGGGMGMPGGGRGGMDGGMGGMRMPGGGMRPQMPKPLKIRAKVQLASAENQE